MNFEVLIDDALLSLVPDCGIAPGENKHVLSMLNDFEGGAWRYKRFENFIWDNVALTSLSHRERLSLVGRSHTHLVEAAKNLRMTDHPHDPGEGSEIAEIALYAIMHHHYKALPVVPKIFYKQNTQDFAKGADSVHIVVTEDGEFTLWLGEAKFYTSIVDSRLRAIVDSVGKALDSEKLRKETSIITSLSDLDLLDLTPPVRESIKNALSQDKSLDTLKPRLHVPILILHQCQLTNACTEMSAGYRDGLRTEHTERATAYFQQQIAQLSTLHLYKSITFHVILFPIPDKAQVVNGFLTTAKWYRDSH